MDENKTSENQPIYKWELKQGGQFKSADEFSDFISEAVVGAVVKALQRAFTAAPALLMQGKQIADMMEAYRAEQRRKLDELNKKAAAEAEAELDEELESNTRTRAKRK